MPFYDYRCPAGHVSERRTGREVSEIVCECGASAQRLISANVGRSGFAPTPTAQAPIHFGRYLEAQGEVVEASRKLGIEPPDLWGLAKERIRRGDIAAIE